MTTPGGDPAQQHDAFHPHLKDLKTTAPDGPLRMRLHHIRTEDVDPGTTQTEGMRRFAAISGQSVGSERLWMGQTHVAPDTASANHHHGESETAIFVVRGHPEFVFAEERDGRVEEVRLRTRPGDYIFVPPFVPHREENPDPDDEAVVVIARSTQEAIVVNLPELYVLEPGQ
ncbi:cupin domain-containing protein [Streptomyces antimycoticus]|uniref:cupin domain-containing protein n=1 Tax=Streptomyces antimycoticus TaxID=68175 RepID=UPI0037D43443